MSYSFPKSSPNGEEVTLENGVTYKYNSIKKSWVVAAILDSNSNNLGYYSFHRSADWFNSGIAQCLAPNGAPKASTIQKLLIHKTNADGSTNDLNAVLKAGNTLKLSKGEQSNYYKNNWHSWQW